MPDDLWFPSRESLDLIAAVFPSGPFTTNSPDSPLQLLVRDEALLDSALATVRQPYYPTVVDKAGALLRSMAKNHPFVDGNKRMAFAATLLFLWANGYVFAADEDQASDLVLEVASQQMGWEDVSARLSGFVVTAESANQSSHSDRVARQLALIPELMESLRGE